MRQREIPTTLLLDIGGVLLTNGWDRDMRKKAAQKFNLDLEDMNERHRLTYDTYESGKITLDEYLDRTVFYMERDFSRDQFKNFIYAQSREYPEMIGFVRMLKANHKLKVGVISNEGRELVEYRITKSKLREFVDFFVCSCFVQIRKPDMEIFRIALDIGQASPEESLYIDDRAMFVDVARRLGVRGICHTSPEETISLLGSLGLGQSGPNQRGSRTLL